MKPEPKIQVAKATNGEVTIYIYDAIGEDNFFFDMFSAKDMRAALKEAGNADVTIRINSLGGDAYQAISMYNQLKDHSGGVTVVVDGMAASAASVIAMAGETVEMRRGAQLMIHEPHTIAIGDAAELEKTLQQLRKTTESALDIYEDKTGKSRQSLAKMMKDETWLSAEEAKTEGFADSVATSHAMSLKASAPQLTAARERFTMPEAALSLVSFGADSAQQFGEGVVMSDTTTSPESAQATDDGGDGIVTVTADLQSVPATTITMSLEDYEKLKAGQVDSAEVTAEDAVAVDRKRSREITAKCQAAGMDQSRIDELIESGVDLATVELIVKNVMISSNRPAADGAGGEQADENAAYRQQYREAINDGVSLSCSEDEYVNVLRREAGKQPIELNKKGGE